MNPSDPAALARALSRHLRDHPPADVPEEVAGLVAYWTPAEERVLPPGCDLPPEIVALGPVPGERRLRCSVGLRGEPRQWAMWTVCRDCGAGRWQAIRRDQRARCRSCAPKLPRRRQQGEERPSAKLDREAVRAIRTSEESGPVLAARYGVSRSLVSLIRRGKGWAWVDES